MRGYPAAQEEVARAMVQTGRRGEENTRCSREVAQERVREWQSNRTFLTRRAPGDGRGTGKRSQPDRGKGTAWWGVLEDEAICGETRRAASRGSGRVWTSRAP